MTLGSIMALVIIAVILSLSLKTRNPEISSVVSLAICVAIIALSIGRIGLIVDTLKQLASHIKVEYAYLVILLKLVGIAYICEFASGISKDAGYSAVSAQIELLGKLTMLMVALPVLIQVIETILVL
ncbi:MAG: stage III sporulation protein AD [Clostridium sp.]|nr:stage III sporulation protein AD [Clostridium sp.]MCM1399433.1 stage III sporulation protein AD [Clostridium sp.]MCM1459987.1 hypothetical protein [Bacteroides sp.]